MQFKLKPLRIAVAAVGFLLLFLLSNYWYSPYSNYSTPLATILRHRPHADAIGYKTDARVEQLFTNTLESSKFTKEYLESFLNLPQDTITALKDSFNGFVQDLKSEQYMSFGNLGPHPKGIVTIGGGKFTWLALLSISQIRSTGCTLPIEIFIPYHEHYDKEFCAKAETDLNAKCIRGPSGLKLDSFQWKLIAIYYSSFQNVLFLDSDNTVLKNPNGLFSWDKYLESGLVLWPDAWTRTTHPAFYDIIGVEVKETASGKFHDNEGAMPDPTNESGMILVNKVKHTDTLFVALYLNIFGPEYYYPLITQGGAGEGDKDTFMASVFALGMPYYVVYNTLHFIGYFKNGREEFHSNALSHCNPLSREEKSAAISGARGGRCHDVMFIHLSFPKYYLETLGDNLTKDGKDLILYETLIEFINYDFELQFWENLAELLCDNWLPDKEEYVSPFRSLGGKLKYIQDLDVGKICDESIEPHLNFLRKWFKTADKSISQFDQK